MNSKLVRFAALVGALLLAAASAWAQDRSRRAPTVEEVLIDLEARVTFNEALWSYHDLALIHQIVEGHGDDPRARLRWLRYHSGCVSGYQLSQDQARTRPGNCVWSRNLRFDGAVPHGWPYSAGFWRHRIRRRWLEHVPRVRDFVMGRDGYRPCPETPQTWDGVRYGRACIETGDCRRRRVRYRVPRRIVDCDVAYTSDPEVEGLHNFGVVFEPVEEDVPPPQTPPP